MAHRNKYENWTMGQVNHDPWVNLCLDFLKQAWLTFAGDVEYHDSRFFLNKNQIFSIVIVNLEIKFTKFIRNSSILKILRRKRPLASRTQIWLKLFLGEIERYINQIKFIIYLIGNIYVGCWHILSLLKLQL